MPLVLPKENASQEEINAWIVETQEKYNSMEEEINKKTQRENELLEQNQKLFLRVTTKKEETKEEDEEIPFCIDKATYEQLSKRDIEELNELIESEE